MENQDSIKGERILSVRVSDNFYNFISTLCKDTDADISQHMRAALLMYVKWNNGEKGVYGGFHD